MRAMLLDQLGEVQCSHLNVFRPLDLCPDVFERWRIKATFEDQPDKGENLDLFSAHLNPPLFPR